eukprot:jgi/Hompol1/3425/HPOL_003236-RA
MSAVWGPNGRKESIKVHLDTLCVECHIRPGTVHKFKRVFCSECVPKIGIKFITARKQFGLSNWRLANLARDPESNGNYYSKLLYISDVRKLAREVHGTNYHIRAKFPSQAEARRQKARADRIELLTQYIKTERPGDDAFLKQATATQAFREFCSVERAASATAVKRVWREVLAAVEHLNQLRAASNQAMLARHTRCEQLAQALASTKAIQPSHCIECIHFIQGTCDFQAVLAVLKRAADLQTLQTGFKVAVE